MISSGSFPVATASGNGVIRRLVRQIFLARKKSQERPPLLRHMIANRPSQHRITALPAHPAPRAASPVRSHPAPLRPRHFASVRKCAGSTTRIMPASALRPKAPPANRARSASSYRRRPASVHLSACRAEINAARIQRVHRHRIAQHVHVAILCGSPFVSASHSLPPARAAVHAQFAVQRKVLANRS